MARKAKKQKNNLAEALERTKGVTTSVTTTASAMKQMSAQQLVMTGVLWLIAHSLIIYLANRWYPEAVVLGTNVISPLMAIFYSMVVFTIISVGAIPVIELLTTQLRWRLSNLHWFAIFLVVDVAGMWLVTRFAEQLGLGISWWLVAVVLGVLMDVVQGLLVKVATPE